LVVLGGAGLPDVERAVRGADVGADVGLDRLGAIERRRLLEGVLEALGDPDLARLDERLDAGDVAQQAEAAAHGHRLAVPVALEADPPVVHRDPELRLARRLEELDLDSLRDADRLARLAMQHQERVAVLLDEDAVLPALLDRAMQRIAHLRLARARADE